MAVVPVAGGTRVKVDAPRPRLKVPIHKPQDQRDDWPGREAAGTLASRCGNANALAFSPFVVNALVLTTWALGAPASSSMCVPLLLAEEGSSTPAASTSHTEARLTERHGPPLSATATLE